SDYSSLIDHPPSCRVARMPRLSLGPAWSREVSGATTSEDIGIDYSDGNSTSSRTRPHFAKSSPEETSPTSASSTDPVETGRKKERHQHG
ncbi:unnamed protein product, partial [Amoebophrya sp. A25]